LGKRRRDYNLVPPKRRQSETSIEAPEETHEQTQTQEDTQMQTQEVKPQEAKEEAIEDFEREFQDAKTARRRAWLRKYLDEQALKNPAANFVIMNITMNPEQENEILDRLRIDKQGRILGWLRGG